MHAQADLAGMDEPVDTDGVEKLAIITKTSKCDTAYKMKTQNSPVWEKEPVGE